MLPRPTRSPRHIAFSASLLAGLSTLSAQTVNWDGGGTSNTGGDWLTNTNWAGDVTPSTTAITAGLVNVSSGTRTISINSGQTATAKNLLFTQTTAGASNILSVASGGTLNLGGGQTWAAPTAGTSRVDLGGTIDFTGLTSGSVAINTDLTFTGAGAVLRSSSTGDAVFTLNGVVNVNAGVGTAQIAYFNATNLKKTNVTFGASSTLSVNTGTLEIASVLYNSSPAVTLTLQGATTLASGARINLVPDSGNNAAGGSSGVTFANSGNLSQAGTLMFNPRGNGGTTTLTNSGTWRVNGLDAVLEKGSRVNTVVPSFSSSGAVTGSSSADKLDYNHLATPGTNLALANSGAIAPGAGTNGSGLASVGTLTLVDIAVTNTSTASIAFDVGGISAGQFDVLALQSGAFDFTNSTLAITLVNGFTPAASFSVPIFTADGTTSVSGTFLSLTVNGAANPDYAFSYNSATGVGSLSFTSAIPEPSSTAALLGLVALGSIALRRRRAQASA